MKMMLTLLIFIFSLNSLINAQKLQLGFNFESNEMKYSNYKGTDFSTPLPTGLQIHMAIFPIEDIALEGRLGAELSQRYYSGAEYGLFIRYYFLKQLYGVTGLMFHNILPDAHNTYRLYDKTLNMPAIGLGYNIGGPAFIEAMFLNSENEEVGNDFDFDSTGSKSPIKINWILKLGFGLSFSL